VDGRVVREYVGCGALAEQAARVDALGRELARHERDGWRAERASLKVMTEAVVELDTLVEALARTALRSAGYHQHHRGDWRKRRGDKG
jgi:hypothetical protein